MPKFLIRLTDPHQSSCWFHLSYSRQHWKLRKLSTDERELKVWATGERGQFPCPPDGYIATHRVPIAEACSIADTQDPGISRDTEIWLKIVTRLEGVKDRFKLTGPLIDGDEVLDGTLAASESATLDDTPDLELCMTKVHELLAKMDSSESHINPTCLFEEGWLLRLCLQFAFNGIDCLPFRPGEEATWYSEVSPPSCFSINVVGNTWFDGVVGHCGVRPETKRGLKLLENAKQFIVIEAKMFSPLKRGVKNVKHFSQVSRAVTCMAKTLSVAGRSPKDVAELSYVVFAPNLKRGSHDQILHKTRIRTEIQDLIDCRDHISDNDREALKQWMVDWCDPMLEQMTLECVSWESIRDRIGTGFEKERAALDSFYRRCRKYNK
jgi:hypothetical protein